MESKVLDNSPFFMGSEIMTSFLCNKIMSKIILKGDNESLCTYH